MSTRDSIAREEKTNEDVPGGGPLKVLIVGESESLEHGAEMLGTLHRMGYRIALVGPLRLAAEDLRQLEEPDSGSSPLRTIGEWMQAEPPDLVVLTSDHNELRRAVTTMVSDRTRILDSFALKIIRSLQRASGQLETNRNKSESVELVKEVLMSGPETSIMVVDEDLNVQEINNAILNRTKMSRDNCISRPCYWVIRKQMEPCDMQGQSCMVRDVLRTGRSVHTVREDAHKHHGLRYFTVSGYPLKDDERGKRNVLIVWKDVTSAMTPVLDRQAENIREDFTHILRQDKMAALGKLASAAVHEINNPIQGILTFAKLMGQELDVESPSSALLEKFRKYLELIATESARCGKIVQNLLSFARQGELNQTTIDLSKLTGEIALLMGHRMLLQGVEFSVKVPKDLPPIYGDRNQIKQGILNLLLNAVEAMPDGGSACLAAAQRRNGSQVVISVTDSGIGIPDEIQSNIFEPFFTTKDEGKGVGLGLSVVYGIVTQHGGTIEVDSVEGKGTSFTLTLPVARETPGDVNSTAQT